MRAWLPARCNLDQIIEQEPTAYLHTCVRMRSKTSLDISGPCVCVMVAGGVLTCPVHLYNTGNVALASSLLTSPASGCRAGLLLPFGPSVDCNVTVTTTQGDFEQGFVNLTVAGIAAPRPLSGPASITWDGHGIVRLNLMKSGRMRAEPDVPTVMASSAGELGTNKLVEMGKKAARRSCFVWLCFHVAALSELHRQIYPCQRLSDKLANMVQSAPLIKTWHVLEPVCAPILLAATTTVMPSCDIHALQARTLQSLTYCTTLATSSCTTALCGQQSPAL